MALLFWDASALAKRYTAETGREVANLLFREVPLQNMASTPWGYAETYSILLRRRNSGMLDAASFATALTALQSEVVDDPEFLLLTVRDESIFASVSLMHKHNLNSTDASLLTTLLEFAGTPGAPQCVLVATDKRFLRAADAEGVKTLNPETCTEAEVPGFLALLR